MYLDDKIYALKTKIIKNFRENNLTLEDSKHVYIIEEECKHGENPWGGKCYYVGKKYLYFKDEAKCNLDRKSINLANIHKNNTIKCQVLVVKLESPIAKELGLDYSGFYYYNSDRLAPDSILALKLVNVIDPPPKNKGYTIVG